MHILILAILFSFLSALDIFFASFAEMFKYFEKCPLIKFSSPNSPPPPHSTSPGPPGASGGSPSATCRAWICGACQSPTVRRSSTESATLISLSNLIGSTPRRRCRYELLFNPKRWWWTQIGHARKQLSNFGAFGS